MEYAWLANFTGCPAISCPVAYFDAPEGREGKVPVSLMAMGEWGDEDGCIEFGYDVERFLEEELEDGRVRAGNWVDVVEFAKKGTQNGK